ncbi:MAG: hypothetical protein V4581_03670 [Bacteroidota bacterium]
MGKKIDGTYTSSLKSIGLTIGVAAYWQDAVVLFLAPTFCISFMVKLFKPNAYKSI